MLKKAPILLALPLLAACGPTTINVIQPATPSAKASASPSASPSAAGSSTLAPSKSPPPTTPAAGVPSPSMSAPPTSTDDPTPMAPGCTPATVAPDLAPEAAGAYAGFELPGSWNSLYKTEAEISAAIASLEGLPYPNHVKCNYPILYARWQNLRAGTSPSPAGSLAPDCTPPTVAPDVAPPEAGVYAGLELPGGWNSLYKDEVEISKTIAWLWRPGQKNHIECNYPKAYAAWQQLYGAPCAPETAAPDLVTAGAQAGMYAGLSLPRHLAEQTEAEISASIASEEGLPYPNGYLCRHPKAYDLWEKAGRPGAP